MTTTTTHITIYPYAQLGGANHGWLNSKHHFSFATYRNPNRMHFGTLRVINDDRISGGEGFDTHPHNDMEIITYVRQGAITHRDSMGNLGRTAAGDVQVMSAGKGIFHSEYNNEHEETVLYQLWIYPNEEGVTPRWDAKQFPKEPVQDQLKLLVSGRKEDTGKDALFIHQDAAIYGGRLTAGTRITHPVKYQAYILASQGDMRIDGKLMHHGDGAEVTGTHQIAVEALTDAEILVIDVPPMPK
jgi:redox-sensitive bicupin YhaK (pirin superfamily)